MLGYALCAPAVAWVLFITVYPIVFNFWLSVHKTGQLLESPQFVGARLYLDTVRDIEFWAELRRTIFWTAGSLLATVLPGLALAVLLDQDFPGARAIRTWILMPWMFPIVVVTMVWIWLLDPTVGLVNVVLRAGGLVSRPVTFLGLQWAMVTVVLVNAWRWIPFVAVTLLGALLAVPRELDEVARVDGASFWARFRFVALPHILPTLGVVSFMLVMWFFNMFPPIWLMTRGGPADVTTTLPVAIYRTAFQLFQFGRGAVLGVVLFVFVAVFAVLYLLLIGRQQLEMESQA